MTNPRVVKHLRRLLGRDRRTIWMVASTSSDKPFTFVQKRRLAGRGQPAGEPGKIELQAVSF